MGVKASPHRRQSLDDDDLGGVYHLKHHEGEQFFVLLTATLLPARRKNYAYVGMYWTWGKRQEESGRGQRLVTSTDARNGISLTRSLKRDFHG